MRTCTTTTRTTGSRFVVSGTDLEALLRGNAGVSALPSRAAEGLRRSPLKGKYRRISSKERRDAFFFYPEIWIEGIASNNKPAAKAAPQIATIKRRLYGI